MVGMAAVFNRSLAFREAAWPGIIWLVKAQSACYPASVPGVARSASGTHLSNVNGDPALKALHGYRLPCTGETKYCKGVPRSAMLPPGISDWNSRSPRLRNDVRGQRSGYTHG